jgi:hypothetical protein
MERKRRSRPVVESLEDKWLLNAAGASVVAAARAVHKAGQAPLSLSGTVQGTWMRVFTIPDTGGTQNLSGSGKVPPVGSVQASGTLHTPGFIARGRTTGTLTLSNSHGSITLNLVGAMDQPGFSAPPASFNFTVAGGTGQFAHATGTGTASFQENTSSFSLTLHPSGKHP